ncbi:fatty-acid amide hydrolase 2 [Caerostris extrusa]|uniref:Fatty-acid amide hydrolase 2 n=1 Tax=Caerostris extrusa TaxID=172846 RepID=A0AAV4NWQ1_CAEEX|nr:fatty-acid amide hydrolase 2 [Caerostris extrusa]
MLVFLLIADFFRAVLTVAHPLANCILNFVYRRLIMGPNSALPSIDSKILLMPATELAEKIRKRQISCKDVMRTYIQRSQLIHPHINGVVDDRYVDALQDAIAVDRFLESGEKTEEQIARETPLLGVPFSCKEVLGIKGKYIYYFNFL